MIYFFSHLLFWHWFSLALILVIFDVVVGANFLFLWCGVAAFLVGLITLITPSLPWEYQFVIFGFGVMASLFIWQHYLKKSHYISDNPLLNQRAQQYIGRILTLETPIINGTGKARVEDTHWRVEGPDLPANTQVRVIGVNGVILKVEKVQIH